MAPNAIVGFSILLLSGSAMILGLVRQFGPTLRRRRD